MTTPNWTDTGDIPAGAANYGGLAAFAAKTQQDWEDDFKTPFETTATDILEGLFGDLPTGGPFGLTMVTEIVRQLIGDPEAVFTSITDALGSIGEWAINLVVGGVSAVLQQIDEFFSEIPELSTWLDTFKALIDGLLGIVDFESWVDVFKTVVDFFAGILDINTWLDVFKTVIDFFGDVVDIDNWLALFKTIIDFFAGILNIETWLTTFQTLIDGLLGITSFETWVAVFKQVNDFFAGIGSVLLTPFLTTLQTIVDWFTGLGETSPDDFLSSLPVIGDVIDVIRKITGIESLATLGEGLTELIEWTQRLPSVASLVSSVLGSWKNPLTGTANTLVDLAEYATKLLTDDSVVPTINLYGILPPDLTALIPVGHVGDSSPNLVTDEGFSAQPVIQAGGGWTWDGTTNSTGSSSGSAKVVGDGGVKQLLSNMIQVAEKQTLDLSASVKWTKSSANTPTFLIGVRGYNASGVATFTTTFASVIAKSGYTSASSTAAYTVGANTTASLSGGWVTISGKTTAIPAGTTQVRMLLGTTNAPSGVTAWFDDASAKKTQKLAQELINGLLDALGLKLPTEDYQSLLDKITSTPKATLQQVATTIAGFLTSTSALDGSNILSGDIDSAYISDLVNTWVKAVFGIGGQTTSGSPDDLAQKLSDLTISVKTQTTSIQENTQNIGTKDASGNLFGRVRNLETALSATPNGVLARLKRLEDEANFSTVTPPAPTVTPISVFDSFDGRTTMGTNWYVYETFNNGNSLSIPNSQDAQYVCPQFNSSTQQVMAIWNGTGKASATKFQKLFATFGSAAGIPLSGSMGFNDFIGLANPSVPTQGIIWRFYADGTSKVFYRTTSLESNPWSPSNLLGSFSAPISTATGKPIQLGSGMPVEVYIGDKAGVVGSASNNNVLYAKLGGAIIGPVNVGSSVIGLMGSANGWGFGMGQGLSAGILGQGASQVPATLGVWGAQDQ